MRRAILSLLLTAIFFGCTADNKLHVKIDVKNLGDTLVAVTAADRNNRQTFVGKQGVFDFEIEVAAPTTLTLAEPGAFVGNPTARYFQIPAVPGEEAVITSTEATRFDITGSKFYADYHEADIMIEEAQKGIIELTQKCQAMIASGTPQDSVMNIYRSSLPDLQKAYNDKLLTYIKAHADQEAMAAVVPEMIDPEQMKAAVALLSPSVRDGRCKPLYQAPIDAYEAQQKAEEATNQLQAEGREAPDFTLNDLNGKPLSLSSLRGKYVILDFWGSWCIWCIKGFPEMKNYYQKYAGKFEILGIDCNDSEQKWKDAVKKHELPWLHVYNPRDSKLLADYGIQGFPTKIIVGPDGKIVKTIVGEDPAFYTLLDQLFK